MNAVSGDAVVGFDNDAASLYVGVQLRADLEQAAVALAARATADAAALARLLPANAPTDLAGKARAFYHRPSGLRAYRRPLADAELSGTRDAVQQRPLSSTQRRTRSSAGSQSGVAGAAAVAALPVSDRARHAGRERPHPAIRLRDCREALAGAGPTRSPMTRCLRRPPPVSFTARPSCPPMPPGCWRRPAGAAGRDHLHFQVYRLGAYDGITRDTTVFPKFTARGPCGHAPGGAAVPTLGLR